MKKATLFLLIMLITSGYVFSQSDEMLLFQGELIDQSRQKLDGTYAITFLIFPTSTGGTALWSQTINNVEVQSGNLSVLLGGAAAQFPTDLFSASPTRYMEIIVNSGATPETLSPRMKITSSVYTLSSTQASAECPDGMVKVGYFCIDENRRGPSTYTNALSTCDNLNSRLCTWTEQMHACELSLLDINKGTSILIEWNPDQSMGNRACVWGNGDADLAYCYGVGSEPIDDGGTLSMFHYRCCK